MRIALTGASGFVGRATVPLLLAAGHSVEALVRDPTRFPDTKGLRLRKGNLSDHDVLKQLVANCDVVLHMAGAIKGAGREDFFATNVDGTKALAEASAAAEVKRFVCVSSLAARAPGVSHYAASKRAAEDVVRNIDSSMERLILRPSAVYGPGDMATLPLLKALMARVALLPGRADARFSLIHVNDLAAVLCDAVSSHRQGLAEVDDLAGGHGWSDLIAVTRKTFGLPQRSFHLPRALAMAIGHCGDAIASLTGRAQMVSSGKMREMYMLDWTVTGENWPRQRPVSLANGLPSTIRWYQAQGLLPHHATTDRRRASSASE